MKRQSWSFVSATNAAHFAASCTVSSALAKNVLHLPFARQIKGVQQLLVWFGPGKPLRYECARTVCDGWINQITLGMKEKLKENKIGTTSATSPQQKWNGRARTPYGHGKKKRVDDG